MRKPKRPECHEEPMNFIGQTNDDPWRPKFLWQCPLCQVIKMTTAEEN